MNLARTIGVGAGFLGILAYGHVIPVRLAVLTFWLFAFCLVYLVFILAGSATKEIMAIVRMHRRA
jgi:hypothetical protein